MRVLKPGGLYILSDTGIGGVGAWIDNHILFKLAKSGDCHTTNRKGIEKMMRNVGFAVTDSRQIQGMIRRIRATLSLWRRQWTTLHGGCGCTGSIIWMRSMG